MEAVPPLPRNPGGTRTFLEAYTQGLTTAEVERVFTRDAPDAYRFFSRHIDFQALSLLPWHRRPFAFARLLFLGFTLRLTPARRLVYGLALAAAIVGLAELFDGFRLFLLPRPTFEPGTIWLLSGFLLVNLLVLLEVADRLTLKNDLEVARGIQLAMLPTAEFRACGLEAFGMTRPANTVGGDFYDIIPLRDGRVLLALGDVAGKGSPASLLMALLLAMMRTLADEGVTDAALMSRLNAQLVKHVPPSRFVTLFAAVFDPASGALSYVNAGQNPPLLRRRQGGYERLREGGMALGMFEHATYEAGRTTLEHGDLLVMYSDGVSEAENASGEPFDERGLQLVMEQRRWKTVKELGWVTFESVDRHRQQHRLNDDLTILAARRVAAES